MRAVTISSLRNRIKFFLNLVVESSEVLIIPRTKDDEDGVVIISLKEYNALTETNYLLSSEANRKRLLDSMRQLESEKLIPYPMEEEKGMNIEFTPDAWKELNYWIEHDKAKVEKINELLRSIKQNPFKGLGSPEPLRHELKGLWSRRIDYEHRLVYRLIGIKDEQKIQIIQCRYHYTP